MVPPWLGTSWHWVCDRATDTKPALTGRPYPPTRPGRLSWRQVFPEAWEVEEKGWWERTSQEDQTRQSSGGVEGAEAEQGVDCEELDLRDPVPCPGLNTYSPRGHRSLSDSEAAAAERKGCWRAVKTGCGGLRSRGQGEHCTQNIMEHSLMSHGLCPPPHKLP